jgi:hypothetical protein
MEVTLMDCMSKEGLTQVSSLMLHSLSQGEHCIAQREEEDRSAEVTSAIDMALEQALDVMDRAILALHLSRNTSDGAERIRFAGQALNGFTAAQSTLDQAEDEVRATETWQVWYEEVRKGIVSSRELQDTQNLT